MLSTTLKHCCAAHQVLQDTASFRITQEALAVALQAAMCTMLQETANGSRFMT
jgi:hypothetical protein